jgi:hypothetical protein
MKRTAATKNPAAGLTGQGLAKVVDERGSSSLPDGVDY